METIPELIGKLGNSDDYFERQKAAWSLVAMGNEAIDALIDALKSGEFSDTRYKAAWILGKIGSPSAVAPLSEAMLKDPDYVVREWCAAALEAVADKLAIPQLVHAMQKDSSKDVRLRSSMALSKLGADEALRKMLQSPDSDIVAMSITALARIKCEAAEDDVAYFLNDPDSEVRRRCAAFMGEIQGIGAIDCLAKSLQDSYAPVRIEALQSLGKKRGETACQLARSALCDNDFNVRIKAVTTLGEIGHNLAFNDLVDILFGQDDEDIRAWAAWSLGELGDRRAVEHLRKACKTCPEKIVKTSRASLEEVFGELP